jgi:hypothetical protein
MQRMLGARSHLIPATTAGIPADAEAEKVPSARCADANIENTGFSGMVAKSGSGSDRVRRAVTASNPFKWRHYPGDIILWCVRWYLRFPISFAHMAEMALGRGLLIHSSCIWRWVQILGP